jgi:Carbohydrate-selective porin, OprB family
MKSWNLSSLMCLAISGSLIASALAGAYGGSVAIALQPQTAATVSRPFATWAVQSLNRLTARHGCKSNAAVQPFQVSQSTKRNEMAAELYRCLTQISDRSLTAEDRTTVQALQQEFRAELGALDERVDFLKSRSAALDSKQFSPTTKFQGQAVITIQGGGLR